MMICIPRSLSKNINNVYIFYFLIFLSLGNMTQQSGMQAYRNKN